MTVQMLNPQVELLERETELGLLAELVLGMRSGAGCMVLVSGAAGVGKTALLRAAFSLADEQDLRVFPVRGTELERDVPYGLVRQFVDAALVGGDPADRAVLLAGPAARAVERVLSGTETVTAADDPTLLIPHGLFWLLANVAARGAVLVAIDDAHWCDPASLRFLRYVAPRIQGLPVLLVVAGRDDASEFAMLRNEAAMVIEPRALSLVAVARLIRARLSAREDADAEFCRACHLVTGGNPFFVHQLIDEFVAQGFSGTAAEARRVHELGPQTVAAAVLLRLSRLPKPALALARAVAILGDQSEYRHVLRLAELDEAGGADAILSLASSGLVEDARPLRFVHPIVRNAIYLDLSRTERARAHRNAAALLFAERAASEVVAPQLLLTDPNADPEVVDALRKAAAEALARGAPDAAVRWLSRALAEPPNEQARGHVLFELGHAEALAHDPSAIEHLNAAVEASEEPRTRAQAARLLSRLLTIAARWPEAVALVDREARSVEKVDPELALTLVNDRVFVTRHTPAPIEDRRTGVAEVRRLLGPRIDSPRTPAERVAVAYLAVDATSLCEPSDRSVAMVELALSGGVLLTEETSDSPVFIVAVQVLLYADRLDAAYELFTAGVEDARTRGSVAGFVMSCCFCAHTAMRQGRVLAAETDARASLETDDTPLPHVLPTQLAALIDALMARDQLQAAADELVKHRLDGVLSDDYHAAFLLESRARLRLAQGRADDALADALDSARRQKAAQMPNPAMVPWGSTAALAAAATGDHRQATRLADEELELARAFGAPRAIGIALRARALVSPRPQEQIGRLREAVDVLEQSPARLDHAQALVDLGAALRRDQQRVNARDPLRKGLDIAMTAGAVALANRAREELAASGAKPRRMRVTGVTALTPSENRIAHMAATGMTNSQIAQSLFLAPRTVEMHLTAAYRKLSITSRAQLHAVLPAERPEPSSTQAPANAGGRPIFSRSARHP